MKPKKELTVSDRFAIMLRTMHNELKNKKPKQKEPKWADILRIK